MTLSAGLLLLSALSWQAPAATERTQTPVEIQEWSVWVTSPTQESYNTSRIYPNAMPRQVGTTRPSRLDEPRPGASAASYPLAPLSVVAVFGDPVTDVDLELRIEKGTLLAHWPPGKAVGPRVRYFGSSLLSRPDPAGPSLALAEAQPFATIRDRVPSLYLQVNSGVERFVAYDAELTRPVPLRLRGGPDRFTLQNLSRHLLRDVALIVPTDSGFRVGWIDVLPTAVVTQEKVASGPKTDADPAKAVGALLAAAEAKPGPEAPKPPPLPEEADATVRARVDALLGRPVQVEVENAPLTAVIDQVAEQARVRVELDTVTLRAGDVDPARPTRLSASGLSGREALAEVLGNAGLSYRISATGSLFITTAARLAEGSGGADAPIEGPPTEVGLSLPLPGDDPSYTAQTRETHKRRLLAAGLRDDMATLLLDQYGPALYRPGELIVLAHLAPEAIEEAVVLDVFPPPRKSTRVALLVIHGMDPRLQDRARQLVRQLGDPSPPAREEAESRLLALGTSVVPALQDALLDPDAEIVHRAERLLLQLGQRVP
jgi:hypothetical protein